ncbi:MAG: CynX/NimT family MFS transporter, partial [Pseudomonadales bacterium]
MLTNRWLWLAVLFLIRITLGFQFQSVGSVSLQLRADLGIGHAEIGTLIGLYMLPGVVIALPSGLLIKRFGDMRTVGYGLLLMIIGAIFLGLSESFTLAILGRIVSGTGLVLLNVTLTKMVIDWFAGREIRTAMGVMLASWPFGIALGLVTQGALADAYSWQFVMFLTGAASAAALIPLLFLARVAPPSAGVEKNVALYTLTRRELLLVSLAGIAWGAFNAGFAIYISFTPGLLIADGFSATDAAALVSIGVWITILSVPIGGFLTEHFGRPQTSIVLFSLLIAITLGLFPYLAIPAVLAVLFGLWMG